MAERIPIDRKHPDPAVIDRAVEALAAGGVIIYPTDTIYGLGCDIGNHDAIKRIYAIKGRDYTKPLSFVCDELSCVAQYAIVPDVTYRALKRTLPGPYTFVLRAASGAPKTVQHKKRKTVGVRIPASAIARMLVKKLGRPIVSTSVNEAGDEPLTSPKKMEEQFGNLVEIILDSGPLPNDPSTIVDWSGDHPVVVRKGKGSTTHFA